MAGIPFNRPVLFGKETAYILDAIARAHVSGDGYYSKRCHAFLESHLGVPKALLCTSCTHALEMAALLLDIQPGDEIILPSFTFVSTANAFVLRGGRPVFADIRPDTLNLDETQVEALVSSRTRAIVPVHYAGVGCEMDAIGATAARHGVPVIEDNAHGLFGKYRGRYLGTLGCLATQSFHETKNVTCGEGGALLINEPSYIERAEILREKGTNRSRFFRGQVDKYTWIDMGSSYLPSDILAAFLLAQLESSEQIQRRRQTAWQFYFENLRSWAGDRDVRLPIVPSHCEQSFHMFYLLLPRPDDRQALIQHLEARGIYSVFHYLPLHLSPMGRRFGGREGTCPVTEDVSDRLLRLPFFNDISEAEQSEVVAAIKDFDRWQNQPVIAASALP
ncbi:MAG TPA: dTDP-4-amino-4,6-dideoxygalactose transaminase [Bryobacteraceae bacterium]|jgi:dTDP-4-amino-4,6-dideoxygalactose transaminase|nr:dTDP-4-amino-4,6-dideoxygalactose transaminase [Bryobacteraceae bacterium]